MQRWSVARARRAGAAQRAVTIRAVLQGLRGHTLLSHRCICQSPTTMSSCTPHSAKDASTASCEPWCQPSHCKRWCKCASCAACTGASSRRGSGDCAGLGGAERRSLHERWERNATGWHYAPAAACELRAIDPSRLRGSVMLVGDSLSRYQFMALVAAVRRVGRPLACSDVEQPVLSNRTADGAALLAERSEFVEMMTRDAYGGAAVDCRASGLSLHYRRLNLLPPPELPTLALRRFYDALFEPLLGRSGVAVLSAGAWYGAWAKQTHEARRRRAGGAEAEEEGLRLFRAGVEALLGLACSAPAWPWLLWREATPQHFEGGGEYRAAAAARCAPLEPSAAARTYAKLVTPVLEALERHRGRGRCGAGHEPPLRVLPAFWPLVPRHTDHLGLQTPSSAGGASKARADCTHWRPSSPAMGVLNALLLDALSRLPQPLA